MRRINWRKTALTRLQEFGNAITWANTGSLGLRLTLTGVLNESNPGRPSAGDTIDYTATLTNTTDDKTFTNVVISDPQGTLIYTCGGGSPLPTLGPGAMYQCTAQYTVLQGDVDSGSFRTTAKANATDPDLNSVSVETAHVTSLVEHNDPPVAIAGGPYVSPGGEALVFDGSASFDPTPGGTIVRYDWDYGDGNVGLDVGPTPSHIYAVPGSYTAILTVYDNLLVTATDTAGVTITVITANPIPAENLLTGAPRAEWESLSAVTTLENLGFTTQESYNVGEQVEFKVTSTDSTVIDIYRMGYYGGANARKVDTVTNTPIVQPNETVIPNSNDGTDVGNWSVTATWNIPSNSVSGIYIAVVRNAAQTAFQQIVFVVRNDYFEADIVVKTNSYTHLAYNAFGGPLVGYNLGRSLYGEGINVFNNVRTYCVSMDRPNVNRGAVINHYIEYEFPLVEALEREGYSVKYITDDDLDQGITWLTNSKILLSAGHDEYWSDGMFDNAEALNASGVHVVFMSGNTIYWRVRKDLTNPRHIWCYKDSTSGPPGSGYDPSGGVSLDPVSPFWTGVWHDWRSDSMSGGVFNRRPGDLLTGQYFRMNAVPSPYYNLVVNGLTYQNSPIWRDTIVAVGTNKTLTGQFGFEGDEWRNSNDGRLYVKLATDSQLLTNNYYDENGASTITAIAYYGWQINQRSRTHGVLFGFGAMNTIWLMSDYHRLGNPVRDADGTQAIVNLFADLGAIADTLDVTLTTPVPVPLTSYGLDWDAPVVPAVTGLEDYLPAIIDSGDASNITVGMKFQVKSPVEIQTIRFYKAAASTGVHKGAIWLDDGTLLASAATFDPETADGWQEATLDTPVVASVGTTYVAGVFHPVGRYSYTPDFYRRVQGNNRINFVVDNTITGGVNPNGVFNVGADIAFPDTAGAGAVNYFTDIGFIEGVIGPPVANVGGPYVGIINVAVNFDGSGSQSNGGTGLTYDWNFGDGNTALDAGPTPSHTYTTENTFTVTLTVTDSEGTDQDSTTATISATEVLHNIFGARVPANADAGPTTNTSVGTEFYFTGISGYAKGVRFWAANAASVSAIAVYQDNLDSTGSGTGTGTLIASKSGLTLTGTNDWFEVNFDYPVQIQPDTRYVAVAYFGAGGYPYERPVFDSEVINGPVRAYQNDLGGNQGNGTYIEAAGIQYPTFWGGVPFASTWYGVDIILGEGSLGPQPPVANAGGPYFTIVGDPTVFDGTGSFDPDGTITQYDWDYGEGAGFQNNVGATPSHTYAAEGNYTATLRVTDNDAQTDTDTASVDIVTSGEQVRPFFGGATPANPDFNDVGQYELGVEFTPDVAGAVTQIHVWVPASAVLGTINCRIWRAQNTQDIYNQPLANPVPGQWNTHTCTAPVQLNAGEVYVVACDHTIEYYGYTTELPKAVAGFGTIDGRIWLAPGEYPANTTANNFGRDITFLPD